MLDIPAVIIFSGTVNVPAWQKCRGAQGRYRMLAVLFGREGGLPMSTVCPTGISAECVLDAALKLRQHHEGQTESCLKRQEED